MNSIILDIDNCIADDGWRIRYIEWAKSGDERYDFYHSRAGYDFPKNRVMLLERHPAERILFLTGRPNKFRPYTVAWLQKHFLPKDRPWELLMRNEGDRSKAEELKRKMVVEWLPHYGVPLSSIVAAYDDHSPVVEMYKELGIPAERLFIHTKDAYAAPRPLSH